MTYNKIVRIDVMIDLNYDKIQQQKDIKTVIKEIEKIHGVIMTKNDHVISYDDMELRKKWHILNIVYVVYVYILSIGVKIKQIN